MLTDKKKALLMVAYIQFHFAKLQHEQVLLQPSSKYVATIDNKKADQ